MWGVGGSCFGGVFDASLAERVAWKIDPAVGKTYMLIMCSYSPVNMF